MKSTGKKAWKRITISLVLCLSLMSNAWPVVASDVSASYGADPFAAMYDSAALIAAELSQAETRYDLKLMELQEDSYSLVPSLETNRSTATPDGALDNAIVPRQTLERYDEESILQREALRAELEREKEQELELIKEALENELMPTRFIVKYKSPAGGSAAGSVSNVTTKRLNLKSGIEKTSQYERLTFTEKVNPRELADQLRRSSLSDEIAYIQPDFTLNLEDLYLSLEADIS